MTDPLTYNLIHDHAKGPFFGTADTPPGFMNTLPDMVVADSFEIIIDWYERYSDTDPVYSNFHASATTALRIILADTADVESDLIVAGSIIGVAVGDPPVTYRTRTKYLITAGLIPAGYGGYACRLIARTEYSVESTKRTGYINVNMVDDNGDRSKSIATSDIDPSIIDIAADTTLTAYPGHVTYRINGSHTVTLPSAAAYDIQKITLFFTPATGAAPVVGTINGDASGMTLSRQYQAATLIAIDGAWWNLNRTPIIR